MNTKIFLLLLILFSSTYTQLVTPTVTLPEKDQHKNSQKEEQLRNEANASFNLISEFTTPEEFKEQVYKYPRNYDLVIFLTAPNCNLCEQIEFEFSKVASFYEAKGHLYTTQNKDGQPQRPVFFKRAVFEQKWHQVFTELGYSTVPNILFTQPEIGKMNLAERKVHLKQHSWSITHTDGTVDSHKILEYINQRTGLDIEYVVPLSDKLKVVFILITLVAFALFLYFNCKSFINSPTVWFRCSFIVYVICSSGIVYNILHDVPLTRNGEWFMTQQRMQLGMEGYIMSGAIGLAGVIMIFWNTAYKFVEDSPLLTRMLYVSLYMGVCLMLWFIEDIYRKKGWYNPLFHPPPNYVQGSYLKDQGNTI